MAVSMHPAHAYTPEIREMTFEQFANSPEFDIVLKLDPDTEMTRKTYCGMKLAIHSVIALLRDAEGLLTKRARQSTILVHGCAIIWHWATDEGLLDTGKKRQHLISTLTGAAETLPTPFPFREPLLRMPAPRQDVCMSKHPAGRLEGLAEVLRLDQEDLINSGVLRFTEHQRVCCASGIHRGIRPDHEGFPYHVRD